MLLFELIEVGLQLLSYPEQQLRECFDEMGLDLERIWRVAFWEGVDECQKV